MTLSRRGYVVMTKKCTKKCDAHQSCLFANEPYCFFAVLVVISITIAKAPYWHKGEYIYCVRKKKGPYGEVAIGGGLTER